MAAATLPLARQGNGWAAVAVGGVGNHDCCNDNDYNVGRGVNNG